MSCTILGFGLETIVKVKKILHPDTKQRQIDSFSEPLNNTVDKVWLDKSSSQSIFIKWSDQSESSSFF